MTFYLITSLIVTIITKTITAITSEGNFEVLSEPIPYDSPKPVPITAEDLGEVNLDNENEINNSSESITSQDRISYHHKKGYYPHRFSHHHHPHLHIVPSHHHHHHRLPYHKPPRKKYRRGRKKPSLIRMPFVKMPFKRQKPILLSEVLRNGGRLPYGKIKTPGPVIKDYIEEDDLETSPFSTVDNIEYPSPFSKGRPQSFEIADESPDVLPVQPIEEEVIFPGIPNVKPFAGLSKRPPSSIWSLSKPAESYYDSDGSADSTRNIRYQNKPLYLDKDIASLLQKIKLEGLNAADSQPSSTETVVAQVHNKDNITDLNAAISKLLFPFLSDTAIKQIQLYFKSLPSDKHHQGDIAENQYKDTSKNSNYSSNQYSVTESVKEDDSDNSTYFIMVKSPSYKGLNITKLLTQQFNQQRWHGNNKTEHAKPELASNTTAPAAKESLALQKYIMMLAGISKDASNSSNNENYLPRFNTFQKQARHL
ncbi:uncharacterized protein LOC135841667 [Planococcus citri]|uniref:uncharacterized protein LOC135841667 n=1 Tax=Planococcus citri TaxID=170843 RepID=UPI0031F880A2